MREDCPEGIDGAVYLPDESGRFDLSDVTLHCTLIVEGITSGIARSDSSSLQHGSGSTPAVQAAAAIGSSSVSVMTPPPLFRSVVTPKRIPSVTMKLMQAELRFKKNKPEFKSIKQLHVQITESTANVGSITEEVQNQLKVPGYRIVGTEGFEIFDCPATRGMNFTVT